MEIIRTPEPEESEPAPAPRVRRFVVPMVTDMTPLNVTLLKPREEPEDLVA